MTIEKVAENRCFEGIQGVYSHQSEYCNGPMRFALYRPPQALAGQACPVVTFLSGLTCTEENFTVKAGAQRVASELGLILVAPDTSPRGQNLPGEDDSYDFGSGAGFYLDATQEPWSKAYRMYSYITKELPEVLKANFEADWSRQGITGHSMGGHGALTISLRNPGRFRSTSAFSPIVSPMNCPWGEKALGGYLGPDRAAWREYDACALIEDGARLPDLLVDQGGADNFLEEQLKTPLLEQACADAGISATIRMQGNYDHSYFFISTFMADHIAWHAARLNKDA